MSNKETQTYQAMLEDVDKIVQNVSREEIDLDQMVLQVERGYQLIKGMRARLDDTKDRIETLRLEYEEPAEASAEKK